MDDAVAAAWAAHVLNADNLDEHLAAMESLRKQMEHEDDLWMRSVARRRIQPVGIRPFIHDIAT